MKVETTYAVSQKELDDLAVTERTMKNICNSFGDCDDCPLRVICRDNENFDDRLDELINTIIKKCRVV